MQVPLQVAAEREIARSYFEATPGRTLAAADWAVSLSSFAHPAVRTPAACLEFSGVALVSLGSQLGTDELAGALHEQMQSPAAALGFEGVCHSVSTQLASAWLASCSTGAVPLLQAHLSDVDKALGA